MNCGENMKPVVWVLMGILLGALVGLPSGYLLMQNNVREVDLGLQTRLADLESQAAWLQAQLGNLQSHNAELQAENSGIQAANAELQGNNSSLQTQNAALQNRMLQLEVPRLVTLLGSKDCNWDPNDMRLYIQGEVWNVGTVTAHNCSLHVTLYRGNVTLQDTEVALGNIESGTYTNVSANLHYSGSALAYWTIIPQYCP
jgi:FtsZ-binding cell division protein ZapB